MADARALPEHDAVILLATWGSRVPHRDFRSAGFGCSSIAARRHAGGVAATKLARAVMATRTKLDGYIVSGYYFESSNAGSRKLSVLDWNDCSFEKDCLE